MCTHCLVIIMGLMMACCSTAFANCGSCGSDAGGQAPPVSEPSSGGTPPSEPSHEPYHEPSGEPAGEPTMREPAGEPVNTRYDVRDDLDLDGSSPSSNPEPSGTMTNTETGDTVKVSVYGDVTQNGTWRSTDIRIGRPTGSTPRDTNPGTFHVLTSNYLGVPSQAPAGPTPSIEDKASPRRED